MPNPVDISQITVTSGGNSVTANLHDSQIPDVNEAIEAILDGGGSEIFAHLYVSIDSGAIVTATSPAATYTATSGSGDEAFIEIGKSGTYTITATKSGVSSSSATVAILESGGVYNETINFIRLTINVPSGSDYTITDGTTTITGTSSGGDIFNYLPNTGSWTVSCTDGTQNASETITISSYTDYLVTLDYGHIYGVSWDKSSATTLTRTDDSASFSDPNPYYSGMSGTPSSPFDNLMPWAGMTKETIDGNVLVKIPKFWYKITNTSSTLTIQIANGPKDGFSVSPAHQARNSSENDRDYVYVGRYKCDSSYKSTSSSSPTVYVTRATARSGITSLGMGYYIQDFAMFWTIRMLYLVEFADWNSQAKIGYGCGNDSRVQSTGYTDNMTYHTGTTQSSRTTYGCGTQYRWIEGLWDNVFEWVDGIRFSSSSTYIDTDPSTYSDSSGGTFIGSRISSSGYIRDWLVPSGTLDWALYPILVGGSDSTYVPDYCYYNSTGAALSVGGYYGCYPYHGFFCLFGNPSASSSYSYVGVRLEYLP